MAKIKRIRLTVLIAALITLAIVGTPLSGYAAGEPGCSATVSPDLIIHIPVVRYGDALYSLDLQYLGASGNLVEFSIANVQTTSQDCAVQSSITSGSSLMLNIASLILESHDYDVGLEYVSSQEINSNNVSAKNTSYTFNIRNFSENSDVWKGWSYCTIDIAKAFPGMFVTAVRRSRGSNVTFAKAPEALAYHVIEGKLDYYYYTETVHMGGVYNITSAGPVETTMMDASSGVMTINNVAPKYFYGEGFENMSVEHISTSYSPDFSYTYTGNVTVFAEWLHIPQNIFTRTNDNKLTGLWIENLPDGEHTCTWLFSYHP